MSLLQFLDQSPEAFQMIVLDDLRREGIVQVGKISLKPGNLESQCEGAIEGEPGTGRFTSLVGRVTL